MSCLTRADGMSFGLISDQPCSNQGICINATEYSTQFASLCICNDYYSGESDMFDLRVARLPNGTWLSLDCPNPRIGVDIVFSLQLIMVFLRQILLMWALIAQCRFKGRMGAKQAFEYMPYRVLILDAVVANPLILGLPIQKLLPNGFVIGTDVGVTFCLVLGTFLGSVAYNDFEYFQFHSVVKASSMNFENNARLLKRQRILIGVTRLSYCVFGLTPSFVALGLDKSLGPIRNGEYITLILRNIGISIWLGTQALADSFMQFEIRHLSESLMQANRADTAGTVNVLNYLDDHARKTKSTAAIGSIIWIFFSIPGYAMTIVTCLTVLRTANEGSVLLTSARITKLSEKSASNALVDTNPMFSDVYKAPGSPSGESYKVLVSKRSDLGTNPSGLVRQGSGPVFPDDNLPNGNGVYPEES